MTTGQWSPECRLSLGWKFRLLGLSLAFALVSGEGIYILMGCWNLGNDGGGMDTVVVICGGGSHIRLGLCCNFKVWKSLPERTTLIIELHKSVGGGSLGV